ncbi:MAG: PIN domain-containing protein [Armatimonadetes bacterium]|nr:PIN domain-containing protein [Armatimonadota bacterium]
MIALIVDTNVVSFLFKHDSRAALYEPYIAGQLLGVSFMTLAETEQWARIRRWGEAQRLRLRAFLEDRFVIHWPDEDLCEWWGEAKAQSRLKGRPLSDADAWIAATCLLYRCPLVTHNRKDFESIEGLAVISAAS